MPHVQYSQVQYDYNRLVIVRVYIVYLSHKGEKCSTKATLASQEQRVNSAVYVCVCVSEMVDPRPSERRGEGGGSSWWLGWLVCGVRGLEWGGARRVQVDNLSHFPPKNSFHKQKTANLTRTVKIKR